MSHWISPSGTSFFSPLGNLFKFLSLDPKLWVIMFYLPSYFCRLCPFFLEGLNHLITIMRVSYVGFQWWNGHDWCWEQDCVKGLVISVGEKHKTVIKWKQSADFICALCLMMVENREGKHFFKFVLSWILIIETLLIFCDWMAQWYIICHLFQSPSIISSIYLCCNIMVENGAHFLTLSNIEIVMDTVYQPY